MQEYDNLGFYGKLRELIAFSGYVKVQLERIGSVDSARKYIDNLMNEVLINFEVFREDASFFTDANFETDLEIITSNIDSVMEIAPLIKKGEADYHFLIMIINMFLPLLEKKLPKNVRLARFLNKLIDSKEDLSFEIGVCEEEVEKVIGAMLEKVDEVYKIINGPQKSGKVNMKK